MRSLSFLVRLPQLAAALAALALTFASPAAATLLITIDKGAQHMTVALDDALMFDWPVSTGLRGYDTPAGEFKPFRMEKDHFSREWDDAPMPHSIFFTQDGHAIHGSFDVKHLGNAASHGCVRLSPENARVLYALVRQEGMANTRVVLTGAIPGGGGTAVARRIGRDADYDDGDVVWERPRNGSSGYAARGYYREPPRRYYYREPPRAYYRDAPYYRYLFRGY